MNYKDKIYIVNICNELEEKTKKLKDIIKEHTIETKKITDDEIKNMSEEELQQQIKKTNFELEHTLLETEFLTVVNYGVDCLLSELFFAKNTPLFKKYTSKTIKDIDINKSNYFWDNLTIADIEFSETTYELLDIYEFYKEECNKLQMDYLYDSIEELIDTLCEKYNKYMGLNPGLNIKESIEKLQVEQQEKIQEEKRKIKEENTRMSIYNVIIPGILLAPLATLTINHYNFIFLILTIITFIWLCVGIASKSNSCQECGKWNSYVIIDEEVLDSYVTTENRVEYKNGHSYSYPATVTKERVLQTYKCKNCGNIKYIRIERNK